MTFNSYQRPNTTEQRWKFQGQEHIDDLGLNCDSFKWRNHQPDIGRFFNVDPLADKYVYNSPNAFSENKLGRGIELEGLEMYEQAFTSLFITLKANTTGNDKNMGSALMNSHKSNTTLNTEASSMIKPSNSARMSDIGSVSNNINKNVNEVEKVTLSTAKVVGSAMEFAPFPVNLIGMGINTVASGADQARQVKYEGKDAEQASADFLIDTSISALVGGGANTAKKSAKAVAGESKTFDFGIDVIGKMWETSAKFLKQKFDEKKMNNKVKEDEDKKINSN